jgi:hypothetical protein
MSILRGDCPRCGPHDNYTVNEIAAQFDADSVPDLNAIKGILRNAGRLVREPEEVLHVEPLVNVVKPGVPGAEVEANFAVADHNGNLIAYTVDGAWADRIALLPDLAWYAGQVVHGNHDAGIRGLEETMNELPYGMGLIVHPLYQR